MSILYCPICDARLRRMITTDPHDNHNLVEGWECPDCHYDSVYDQECPVESNETDEDPDDE